MRRTSLHKLLSGLHLRRIKPLTSPLHPSLPLPTSITSNNPKPYSVLSNANPFSCRRFYSGNGESTATSEEVNKAVEEINLKFVEAREEIDLAMESKETVYFNEEAMVAKEAVKEVMDMFEGLLKRVGEEEKGVLRRSMGMKIEQLKAELEQLNE